MELQDYCIYNKGNGEVRAFRRAIVVYPKYCAKMPVSKEVRAKFEGYEDLCVVRNDEVQFNPDRLDSIGKHVRSKRDSLLRDFDISISSPIRWETFSEEQVSELKEYRSELLNVPQQENFPLAVVWPTLPSFLS